VELDYDREICCRPMVIFINGAGDEIRAKSRGAPATTTGAD
jgi:hypothetical protein